MADSDDINVVWQPAKRLLALALCEEMMLKGHTPRSILTKCSELGYTDSISTVRKWCEEIVHTWEAESVAMRPHRRNLWRARLEARYAMMMKDLEDTFTPVNPESGAPRIDPSTGEPLKIPTFTGVARAMMHGQLAKLELLAFKLDGLDAPIVVKHEHEGSIDIRAMSPDQRRERIDELLAKRARLAAGGETGN